MLIISNPGQTALRLTHERPPLKLMCFGMPCTSPSALRMLGDINGDFLPCSHVHKTPMRCGAGCHQLQPAAWTELVVYRQ